MQVCVITMNMQGHSILEFKSILCDVIADDQRGRREPQQDQNRFVLMIHGRKLHRPVLFS